jgi:hypothetical protein
VVRVALAALGLLIAGACGGHVAPAPPPIVPTIWSEPAAEARGEEMLLLPPILQASPFVPHWRDDLGRATAVRFASDGRYLVVTEDVWPDLGCLANLQSTLHVYDAATWQETLIVELPAAVGAWAFADATTLRLGLHRSRESGLDVGTLDIETGAWHDAPGDDVALDAVGPFAVDPTRRARFAQANGHDVTVGSDNPATVTRLGNRTGRSLVVRVLEDRSTVVAAAAWPSGEVAVWDLVAGRELTLEPTPKGARQVSVAEDGAVIVLKRHGLLLHYVPAETGVLAGRRLADHVPADAEIWSDDRRLFYSHDQAQVTLDLRTGRVLSVEAPSAIGLLAGDPDPPSTPTALSVSSGCLGAACALLVGQHELRVLAVSDPGTLVVIDGDRFETLGASHPSELGCRRDSRITPLTDCAEELRGNDLLAARILAEGSRIAAP